MEIFPYILARIAGGSFDHFATWNSGELYDQAINLQHIREKKDTLKKKLCDELLCFINEEIADRKLQNQLQNIRRNIYNDKKLKPDEVELFIEKLPPSVRFIFDEYLGQLERLQEHEVLFTGQFQTMLMGNRMLLKKEAGKISFQKGLLLSSSALLEALPSYLHATEDVLQLNKKLVQTETGIIKYLTRMLAKTSPFSTFCHLTFASVDTNGTAPLSFQPDSIGEEGESVMRLNQILFKIFQESLYAHPAISRRLNICLNPTIRTEADSFRFLINRNNVESFQRMERNELIDYIKHTLSSVALNFGSLTEEISSVSDTCSDEAEAYVRSLTGYGFIEFDLGVSGIDPLWIGKIKNILNDINRPPLPEIDETLSSLDRIESLMASYRVSDVKRRKSILEESCGLFTQLFEKLCVDRVGDNPIVQETVVDQRIRVKNDPKVKNRFTVTTQNVFYEDCKLEVEHNFNETLLKSWLMKLEELLNMLFLFNGSTEDEKLLNFFRLKYGSQERVDLLVFYEDYYRNLKDLKELGETEMKITDSTLDVRKKWYDAFQDRLKSLDKVGKDVVELFKDDISSVNQKISISPPQTNQRVSKAAFVQFYKDDTKLMGVVNLVTHGYGKMFSRFLHMFPATITEECNAWNRRFIGGDEMYVENTDGAVFNANMHPPLLPYEIGIPNGQANLRPSRRIPVSDLQVSCDDKEAVLQLIHHPSGKKVTPFDLGFQGNKGRSALFKLINKFSVKSNLSIFPVSVAINNLVKTNNGNPLGVQFFPRIVYEQQLILQRKTWLITKELLPSRAKSESAEVYYCKINAWRNELGLPDEVFLYVQPRDIGHGKIDQKRQEKSGRDDYKPQFMNFKSPLMISFFEKLIKKVPQNLKIEEMLPGDDELNKIGNQKFVTEHVVSWYKF